MGTHYAVYDFMGPLCMLASEYTHCLILTSKVHWIYLRFVFNGIFASLNIKAKTNRIADNVRPLMHTYAVAIPDPSCPSAGPESPIEAVIKVATKVSKKTIIDDIKSDPPTPIGIELTANVCSHWGHVTVPI